MCCDPNLVSQASFLKFLCEHTRLFDPLVQLVCSYLFKYMEPKLFIAFAHTNNDQCKRFVTQLNFWHIERGIAIYRMALLREHIAFKTGNIKTRQLVQPIKIEQVVGYAIEIPTGLRGEQYVFNPCDAVTMLEYCGCWHCTKMELHMIL